jgi:Lysozyme like domain
MDEKGRHLPAREIAALCYRVGWRDADLLLIAVSVCIAEGNGYEHATHINADGSIDRGLWQINDKAHPTVGDEAAYNASRATLIAHGVYMARGRTFNAWSAYQNGSYKGPRAMGYAFDGVANMLRERHGYPVP